MNDLERPRAYDVVELPARAGGYAAQRVPLRASWVYVQACPADTTIAFGDGAQSFPVRPGFVFHDPSGLVKELYVTTATNEVLRLLVARSVLAFQSGAQGLLDDGLRAIVVPRAIAIGRSDGEANPQGLWNGSQINVDTISWAFQGTGFDRERLVTMVRSAQGTAIGAGVSVTVWTPAAGRRFRLRGMRARSSVAGRFEIFEGGATRIAYVYMPANVWVALLDLEANGYPSVAANNVLQLRNETGGAVDVDIVAWGNEE